MSRCVLVNLTSYTCLSLGILSTLKEYYVFAQGYVYQLLIKTVLIKQTTIKYIKYGYSVCLWMPSMHLQYSIRFFFPLDGFLSLKCVYYEKFVACKALYCYLLSLSSTSTFSERVLVLLHVSCFSCLCVSNENNFNCEVIHP